MAGRPFQIRTWFYALALVGVLLVLAVIPGVFQKKRFAYIEGDSAKTTPLAKFPMDREFALVTATGAKGKVKLADLAKDYPGGLLINFWATWCPPCLEELPSLENLSRQLATRGDKNLPKLVTISVDESVAEVNSLAKTLTFKPTFMVLHDPSGDFSESIGTVRFPETYWVAPDGVVRFKWLGPQDWLSEAILRRLASPPAPAPPVVK